MFMAPDGEEQNPPLFQDVCCVVKDRGSLDAKVDSVSSWCHGISSLLWALNTSSAQVLIAWITVGACPWDIM